MARQHLTRTFFLLLLLLPAVGQSQVAYDRTAGHFTVRSNGLPLTQILAEVSARTGIEISIAPAADRPVSLNIKTLPLEDALRELIKPLNNMFVYQGNTSKVKAVKVFVTSPSEATTRIVPAMSPAGGAGSVQKLPPSPAELEARARQRWEQRTTAREREEGSERRRKQDEERAAWEAREASQKTEQDKRMVDRHAGVMKRLEETHRLRMLPGPGAVVPEPPPPIFEEIQAAPSEQ